MEEGETVWLASFQSSAAPSLTGIPLEQNPGTSGLTESKRG